MVQQVYPLLSNTQKDNNPECQDSRFGSHTISGKTAMSKNSTLNFRLLTLYLDLFLQVIKVILLHYKRAILFLFAFIDVDNVYTS